MRHHRSRRSKYRHGGDRSFRRNGSEELRSNSSISFNSFNDQRKFFTRNSHNAPKLLEKYNNLAREALSNGDKILSENYYQHADHFLRVIGDKNLTENNSKNSLDNSSPTKNSNDQTISDGKNDNISKIHGNGEEI